METIKTVCHYLVTRLKFLIQRSPVFGCSKSNLAGGSNMKASTGKLNVWYARWYKSLERMFDIRFQERLILTGYSVTSDTTIYCVKIGRRLFVHIMFGDMLYDRWGKVDKDRFRFRIGRIKSGTNSRIKDEQAIILSKESRWPIPESILKFSTI